MNKIIVPTDFSTAAGKAVKYAVTRARNKVCTASRVVLIEAKNEEDIPRIPLIHVATYKRTNK